MDKDMKKQKRYTKDERLKNGQKKFDILQKECDIRGMELEELNAVITTWKLTLSSELHARFRKILDPYINRCTLVKDTMQTKYTVKGKAKKEPDGVAKPCRYFKAAGCKHVGGFLCEFPDCELLESWMRDCYSITDERNQKGTKNE